MRISVASHSEDAKVNVCEALLFAGIEVFVSKFDIVNKEEALSDFHEL